jgi:hypothetical protein
MAISYQCIPLCTEGPVARWYGEGTHGHAQGTWRVHLLDGGPLPVPARRGPAWTRAHTRTTRTDADCTRATARAGLDAGAHTDSANGRRLHTSDGNRTRDETQARSQHGRSSTERREDCVERRRPRGGVGEGGWEPLRVGEEGEEALIVHARGEVRYVGL